MKLSKAVMAAALAAGGFGAEAQQPAPPGLQPVRALSVSRDERTALTALQAAFGSPDRAAQDNALAAARAAARSADARYAVAYYQLEMGRARGDQQLQAQAVDALVESGQAQGGELASLLANQASRALTAGDLRRSDRLLARMIELQPDNPFYLADYGQLKARLGEPGQGVILLLRAITLNQAAGRPSPESWHLRGLLLAVDSRIGPQGIALARALVTAYPSPVNWRDALLAYRELSPADPTLDLDVRRLMRATQSLGGERDYIEYAQAANQAGLIGESKSVLDDGLSRGMLEASRIPPQLTADNNRRLAAERTGLARSRTAALAAATGQPARIAGDVHFGHGQYVEAAELYRTALQKGGEDPNLVNARLGAALALAGQRAEAEAALRAVTGPRADLAGFWLAWLSRRPA